MTLQGYSLASHLSDDAEIINVPKIRLARPLFATIRRAHRVVAAATLSPPGEIPERATVEKSRKATLIDTLADNLYRALSAENFQAQRSAGFLVVAQAVIATRHPIKLFDFVNGPEHFRRLHRLDVIQQPAR